MPQGAGYWLDPRTDQAYIVTRHELWLLDKQNADKIGMRPDVFAKISAMDPSADMDAIRTEGCRMGLIRLRDHSNRWGVQFFVGSGREQDYLWSVYLFL